MALVSVLMDTAAPAGSKLDAEMAAEIEELAPGLDAQEVDEVALADGAVTTPKLHDGAVTSVKIGNNEVKAANIDNGSVDTAALQDDSVTAAKAGLGVVTAYDAAGNPVEDKKVYLTAAQYAALATKDPNTEYHVS